MRSVSSVRAVSRMTGRFAGLADVAGQRQAVLTRHHDVEDDEVDRIRRHPRPRALGIAGLRHAEALARQILRKRLADRTFVVDQQQMWRIPHGLHL